ncbi:MAG: YceI family protein [Bacteroidia bacterium]|nr:YceI family protein [Bacteroidia bacterium]
MNKLRFKLTSIMFLFWVFGFAQMNVITDTASSSVSLSCDSSTSSFVIQGTSSLHDWEMTSLSCKGALQIRNDEQTAGIQNIHLKVQVTSLKSGKNVMDKKCYTALKYEDHPNIIYQFQSLNSLKSKGSNSYHANLIGTLNVAGVNKQLSIEVEIYEQNGVINIQGAKALKMSDFNVEPPKALLGTLKTGNEITIVFNLNFVDL